MAKFSPEFFIGAATAAHQVEGNNIHSDCWAMEQMKYTSYTEPSLDAVDHYNRYEEDIRLLAEAGLNAYRFSIEWARIEPEEGKFDEDQIEHYRGVIRCCKENGVEPLVTLHHFSSPKWLICKGGWESDETVDLFARYTRYVAEQLGKELHYVCTINEANMGIQVAAIMERYKRQMMAMAARAEAGGAAEGQVQVGMNLQQMMENQKLAALENQEVFGTPQPQNFTSARTPHGDEIVQNAHRAARAVLREVCPWVKVGLSLSLHDIQAAEGGKERAAKEWEDEFTHYLPAIEGDDFLGVQNYTRSIIGPDGIQPVPEGAEMTQMDYEFYPQALEHVIRAAAKDFHGKLIVTENGIATADDSRRVAFIDEALAGVERCLKDGLPVKGYFHWSLLDNFEWQKGYSMTFGLIAVDRATQTRHPKESLYFLGSRRS
ncbi:MAG: family 1 glycosylhydrolase [Lachnospiraceae bacterium]|nr:family 1 glycosylhydrolase [Lachnospiraceae bacterium]